MSETEHQGTVAMTNTPPPSDHVEPEPDAIEQSYRAGFVDGAKECADSLQHAQETVRGLQRILEELSEKQISKAVIDVIRERRRQMAVEGWSIEHDDEHLQSELAWAAACYALAGAPANPAAAVISQKNIPHALWPWALQWFMPSHRDRLAVPATDTRQPSYEHPARPAPLACLVHGRSRGSQKRGRLRARIRRRGRKRQRP